MGGEEEEEEEGGVHDAEEVGATSHLGAPQEEGEGGMEERKDERGAGISPLGDFQSDGDLPVIKRRMTVTI